MESKPSMYGSNAATSFAPAPAPAPSQPAAPAVSSQPAAEALAPASSPKPAREPKPPKTPRETSGEENVYGLLGLILAFFYPPCGLAVSIVGIFKSTKTGTGWAMSAIGAFISLLLIIAIIIVVLVCDPVRDFLGL